MKSKPWVSFRSSYLGRKFSLFLTFMRISLRGVRNNKIGNQAAALSYYSLMSLGPLGALSVLVSSFVFRDKSEALASHLLAKALVFVAPSVSHLDAGSAETTRMPENTLNPQLLDFMERLVRHAQSGEAGFWGTLVLIAICIQLIITVEKALNAIWSTPLGRPWFQRITAYWAFLTLGTLISLLGFSMVSSSVASALFPAQASSGTLQSVLSGIPSFLYLFLLAGVLALFYRYLPYTHVRWTSAFFGGAVAAFLLGINHHLSFIYIQKVIQDQSLYGSIGIIFVLMFGLFVFWWILLLGGVLSYSFQNLKQLQATPLSSRCKFVCKRTT